MGDGSREVDLVADAKAVRDIRKFLNRHIAGATDDPKAMLSRRVSLKHRKRFDEPLEVLVSVKGSHAENVRGRGRLNDAVIAGDHRRDAMMDNEDPFLV